MSGKGASGDEGQPSGIRQVLPGEISAARSFNEMLLYCANALVFGGGTVALTLILGVGSMEQQSYVALEVLFGGVTIFGAVCSRRSLPPGFMEEQRHALARTSFFSGAYALFSGVATALSHAGWPKHAYTGWWWNLVALALVAAATGANKRRLAGGNQEILQLLEEQQNRQETGSPVPGKTTSPVAPQNDTTTGQGALENDIESQIEILKDQNESLKKVQEMLEEAHSAAQELVKSKRRRRLRFRFR